MHMDYAVHAMWTSSPKMKRIFSRNQKAIQVGNLAVSAVSRSVPITHCVIEMGKYCQHIEFIN